LAQSAFPQLSTTWPVTLWQSPGELGQVPAAMHALAFTYPPQVSGVMVLGEVEKVQPKALLVDGA